MGVIENLHGMISPPSPPTRTPTRLAFFCIWGYWTFYIIKEAYLLLKALDPKAPWRILGAGLIPYIFRANFDGLIAFHN